MMLTRAMNRYLATELRRLPAQHGSLYAHKSMPALLLAPLVSHIPWQSPSSNQIRHAATKARTGKSTTGAKSTRAKPTATRSRARSTTTRRAVGSTKAAPRKPKTTKKSASTGRRVTRAKRTTTTKRKTPLKRKRATTQAKKKTLTAIESKKLKVKELRTKALLKTAPKRLPESSYLVFVTNNLKKGAHAAPQVKELGGRWQSVSASEREHFTHVAEENKKINLDNYARWLKKHTPDQIKVANNARRYLNRISHEAKPAGAKSKLVPHRAQILKDERVSKKAPGPYAQFSGTRWASGDLKGMHLVEANKVLAKEWKALGPDERKKYTGATGRAAVKA